MTDNLKCTCDPGPEGQHRYWCGLREVGLVAEWARLDAANADTDAMADYVPKEKVRAVVSYLRALGHDETGGTSDTRWAYKRSADYIQNEVLPDESR